jgi:outer membrane receptor protein involved in Fe transport
MVSAARAHAGEPPDVPADSPDALDGVNDAPYGAPPDDVAPVVPAAPSADGADDPYVDPPGLAPAAPPGLAPAAPAAPAPAPLVAPPPAISARPTLAAAGPKRFAVTGSLIERATLITPQPLTILRRDDLLSAGRTMIGDILQRLPQHGNGLNAQFNNGGDGSTRINLRSLDSDRTLTLLNGRRFVAGGLGADVSVDLNTVPLAVIDRVEILDDGGSAVYGSEAVGGVVNILTRTAFRGTEVSLYTAETERQDGFSFDASFLTGHRTESGRGHIVFSVGTQRQEPVFAGDREFSRTVSTFDYTSRVPIPSGSPTTPNGRIDATRIDFNGDGNGDPINLCGPGVRFCTHDGAGGYRPFLSPGDFYNFQPVNYLYTPSNRANAYTAGHYELTPHVQAFFEASFLHRSSTEQLAPLPVTLDVAGLQVSQDSVFNPLGGTVLGYNRRLEELGPRQFAQSLDTLRAVIGARGTAPDAIDALSGWQWELSFNYGRTDSTQKTHGDASISRLANAIGPSFLGPSGPICGTPGAQIAGCVPADILGPSGSISAAARDYIAVVGVNTGVTKQQVLLATAHGRVAELPSGGDIALAVSADARTEIGDFTPDPLSASGDTFGVALPSVHGTSQALEAAAEISIVPIRDADGVERLELDAAARVAHFDAFDATTTTLRALARPIRWLTLRASRSSAFRAPSVAERFQERRDGFPFGSDPCDNAFGPVPAHVAERCAQQGVPFGSTFGTSQQRSLDGGNGNVGAETATTMTAGAVLELPAGLSIGIDAWRVDVEQAIREPDLATVFTGCYQRGIQAFCDLVHRDPMRGGAIDFVDLTFTNAGGTSTSGIDASISFDHRAPGLGDLHARLVVETLDHFDLDTSTTVVHGLGNYDLGVHPKRKANLSAIWRSRGSSAGFNLQFIDSFIECESNDCNNGNPSRDIDAYAKVDVFATLALGGGFDGTALTFGINNVFDRAPPTIYSSTAGNYDVATYDTLGRLFYLRLTQSF